MSDIQSVKEILNTHFPEVEFLTVSNGFICLKVDRPDEDLYREVRHAIDGIGTEFEPLIFFSDNLPEGTKAYDSGKPV